MVVFYRHRRLLNASFFLFTLIISFSTTVTTATANQNYRPSSYSRRTSSSNTLGAQAPEDEEFVRMGGFDPEILVDWMKRATSPRRRSAVNVNFPRVSHLQGHRSVKGAVATPETSNRHDDSLSTNTRRRKNMQDPKQMMVQLMQGVKTRKQQLEHKLLRPPRTEPAEEETEEEDRSEHHHHVSKACVPPHIWKSLMGNEFHLPHLVQDLAQTGLDVATDGPQSPAWKPNKHTAKMLEKHGNNLLQVLEEEVLVWTGNFDDGCYGYELPCVKTRGIVPMSPKAFAELLMDSSKVKLYNKMSLGRVDERVFQDGVDTSQGYFGDGETKIVRNLTRPPLTKKIMEFVTLMHARKLHEDRGEGSGYIVVSRAVTGDASIQEAASNQDGDAKMIRSEILLGVNLLRSVEGHPDKTEVTGVTHVNSPMVPTMVAGKVGVKGAIGFINDIRALTCPSN